MLVVFARPGCDALLIGCMCAVEHSVGPAIDLLAAPLYVVHVAPTEDVLPFSAFWGWDMRGDYSEVPSFMRWWTARRVRVDVRVVVFVFYYYLFIYWFYIILS